MRYSNFSEILHSALQFCGLDRNLTTPDRFAMIRDYASRRIQLIWESNDWPDLKRYTKCNVALEDGRSKIVTPADLGQLIDVWSMDPLASTNSIQLDFNGINNGFYLSASGPSDVWVEHRPDSPVLSGDAWRVATSYRKGSQVYYDEGPGLAGIVDGASSLVPVNGYPSKGNFWNYTGEEPSVAGTPPDLDPNWVRVTIPRLFADYVAQGSFSDYSRAQGSLDVNTLGFIENRAENAKEHALDQVLRQQGMTRRINFRGY
jgi:hypothetical protein